jgi:hypothetical protein
MAASLRWLLPVCALLLAFAPPASAWAPETRARMADEAVRLLPASLRLALERQREALLRGTLEPLTHEDQTEHRPPWESGTLDRQVAGEARELIDALGRRTPFRELATRFGRLAHFVMDAGFPPGMGEGDARRYRHFASFCESRRARFPLVFYGHADEDLERGDFAAFARRIMLRAREEDRDLARAYAAAGNPPRAAAFDDRSVPFAVASLSYSRSVTHVARAWIAAWRLAGGDLARTPYADLADGDAEKRRPR